MGAEKRPVLTSRETEIRDRDRVKGGVVSISVFFLVSIPISVFILLLRFPSGALMIPSHVWRVGSFLGCSFSFSRRLGAVRRRT